MRYIFILLLIMISVPSFASTTTEWTEGRVTRIVIYPNTVNPEVTGENIEYYPAKVKVDFDMTSGGVDRRVSSEAFLGTATTEPLTLQEQYSALGNSGPKLQSTLKSAVLEALNEDISL